MRPPMKPKVKARLLGRFSISLASTELMVGAPQKALELLAFLVLHAGRPYTRESLAARMWAGADETHGRKYLRQALWQLHSGLDRVGKLRADEILRLEPGWVCIQVEHVWTDIGALKAAFERTRRGSRPKEDDDCVADMKKAVELYRGELLEGWLFDWCAAEREFYRDVYLTLLDRLIVSCEKAGDLDGGITYATRALECDRARERTHRSLMRLHYLAGDRTSALRQYERCVEALRAELDVAPDPETVLLRKEIRSGRGPKPSDGRREQGSSTAQRRAPGQAKRRER